MDPKAVNILYYGLNADKFYKISICKNNKEIYDRIKVTHDGTNQVQRVKN